MKVPVYHQASLDLIGVVDVSADQLETLRQQNCLRLAKRNEMSTAPYTLGAMPNDSVAFEVIEFRYFPITNGHGSKQSVILTVEKRDWLAAWPTQLWPRRRRGAGRPKKRSRKNRLSYPLETTGRP